ARCAAEGLAEPAPRVLSFVQGWRARQDSKLCAATPGPIARESLLRVELSIRQAVADCPLFACAVRRRRFPVGASPTRRTLQPEATGAVMEVTKWLKPSVWLGTYRWRRRVWGQHAEERAVT